MSDAEITRLRAEVETEGMRLVACGVVARADTPESAAKARDMLPEYRSASCDDVAWCVDECISLRAEVESLRKIMMGARELAREGHAHWDADREAKVGKCLLALSGYSERYDRRADEFNAAIDAAITKGA